VLVPSDSNTNGASIIIVSGDGIIQCDYNKYGEGEDEMKGRR
jgi:hypothetical protein